MRLIRHSVLTCEVSDADVCTPRSRSARTVDENGRGRFLVSRLSRGWGSRLVPGAKVVRAEQAIGPEPSHTRESGPAFEPEEQWTVPTDV